MICFYILYNCNSYEICNYNFILEESSQLIQQLNQVNRDNSENYLGYMYIKNHCSIYIIKLLETYPYFPTNLEGGLIGLIFKTHSRNTILKPTIAKYILSLDWLKIDYDLRNDSAWQAINNRWMLENYQSFYVSNIHHTRSNIDFSISC